MARLSQPDHIGDDMTKTDTQPELPFKPQPLGKGARMADVIARIAADGSLPTYRVPAIASALRTVSRAMGHTLHDMPADPAYLSKRLKDFSPAMAGLKESSWRNALSHTRFALRHTGIIKVPARAGVPFRPAWTVLLGGMDATDGRIGLSRLARYCSDRDIDPDDVNDAVSAEFLAELTGNTVMRMPHKAHRRAVVIWNRMVSRKRGWPAQLLTVPSYSRTHFIGWDKFPASLKADIDAHLASLAGEDSLSVLDRRPLKPRSILARRHQLGAYLSALVIAGADPAAFRMLKDAFTEPLVRSGLNVILKRAPNESKEQAYDIARMLLAVARHWVKADASLISTLQRFCKNLDDPGTGICDKSRDRLRQFDNPGNLAALLTLPQHLVRAATSDAKPAQAEALLVQTALAIELLLMTSMRRDNLARLNVNEHLLRDRHGGVCLRIPGARVKNGVAIEVNLKPPTISLLDLYMTRYRRLLLTTDSAWLFPGLADRPKSRERLAMQITATIRDRLGLHVNVHLFRHIAAKIQLEHSHGNYAAVRFLLGHKSLNTTIKTYCSLEARAAVAHFDEHILALRAKPAAAASRRKAARS